MSHTFIFNNSFFSWGHLKLGLSLLVLMSGPDMGGQIGSVGKGRIGALFANMRLEPLVNVHVIAEEIPGHETLDRHTDWAEKGLLVLWSVLPQYVALQFILWQLQTAL